MNVSCSQSHMEQLSCLEEIGVFENPPYERGEELRGELRGKSDGSQPIDIMMDDREAGNDFWSIEGHYIYRHRVEPRVKLHMLEEESFPIPLRDFEVVRRTTTPLGVLLESRLDDYLEH